MYRQTLLVTSGGKRVRSKE